MKKAPASPFFLVVELVVEPVETLSRHSVVMPAGQVRESLSLVEVFRRKRRLQETMSKHSHTTLVYKVFLLTALWGIVLSGCSSRSEEVPRLRIANHGSIPIKNLVVLFPHDRIEFGDVPAGTTTEYKEASNGVFRYAAYQFEVDGQVVTEPAIDWIGESPLSGILFTYTIDFDPNRTNTGDRVRLIEVKNDE